MLDERIFQVMAGVGVLALVGVVFSSCLTSPEDMKAKQRTSAKEGIITVSPRAGVECYILPADSTLSPRAMSCVALPETVQ